MINLSLSLEGQTVNGTLTDDIENEITMESSRSYQSASIDAGIEAGTEVEVEVGSFLLSIDSDQLEGTNEERIQFAADMTAAVVKEITAERDQAREALSAARAKHDDGQQAICDLRAAGMRLAAVWPAVLEAMDPECTSAHDSRNLGIRAAVLAALRTLGLEPEAEAEVEPDLDTAD